MNIVRDPRKMLIRTAAEAKRYRIQVRVIPAVLGAFVVLIAAIYVISAMYDKYGSYTVSVNKLDNIEYTLALCEEENFNEPTSRLNTRASEDITNISVRDLPEGIDSVTGGIKSGDNYLAYTYFCKNVGKKTINYEYMPFIVNTTQQLDTAVRVRLYVDGEEATYAKTSRTGGAEEGTIPFASATTICRKQIVNFQPGDITRYTVIIWIEGDDEECTDDLIGGRFKIDMKMSVVAVDTDGDGIVDANYRDGKEESGEYSTPESSAPSDESNSQTSGDNSVFYAPAKKSAF